MLKIKNTNKIIGEWFCNDRYVCSNFVENEQYLEFWFNDTTQIQHKGHWVRIQREAKWDAAENKWMYQIHRPDYALHYISTDWFADIDNAKAAFEDVLKDLI